MWIFGWVMLAFVAGYVGRDRKIGFGWAFFWSLLLSPFIGLIIAFASDKKIDIETQIQQAMHIAKLQEQHPPKDEDKNLYEQIKEAKSLLDSEAITQEEFEIIKGKILNK